MVLEKDEEFEIDYVSPEEDEEATTEDSDADSKLNSDDSDHDFSFDEAEEDDVSSLENTSMHLSDYSDIEMDEDCPPLELPESSKDLLVPNNLVLPVLGVYETLRHFRSCLRLSPMLFEDFCAALVDEETNILLTECFTSVLKSILREEDSAGVLFGPHDQKDSIWAAVGFIDHMTWPEIVRGYLESTGEHPEALKIAMNPKFPRVNVEDKVKVLKTLTDIYLTSNKIRDQLMTDGVIHYDDNCRVCHKLGDLLCCETCPAVYHLACCDPPLVEVPDDEWQCEICVAHKLNGVFNCEPQQEFKSQYLRHEPIGMDRHGNKYWFLARRLIVERAEEVRYYSTMEQYEEVLSKLDPDRYEIVLFEALKDVTEEFPKQCILTEELTREALPDEKTTMYLDALKARVKREKEEKLEQERLKKMEEEKRKQKEEE
uniref:nucleosome-remodeling factor subunit BPTF-like n=1 Tax=Styela clava TaxID=7725 RepID=UPI00193A7192|nr:nucleosome-remodeling factor subunit BPTF-like [Styela clava]